GLDCRVAAFLDDMAAEYTSATVIISRAGATTLAELACAGRPVLLVPFPQAADDHQAENARHWADHGAAIVVPQRSIADDTATDRARAWHHLQDEEQRHRLATAAATLAQPDAADAVVMALMSELAKDPARVRQRNPALADSVATPGKT